MSRNLSEAAFSPNPAFLESFLKAAGPGTRFAPPEEGGMVWSTVLPVAGFRFHQGPEVLELLRAGDPLEFTREPENPHDPLAVRIGWLRVHPGYLPRTCNALPSALLDQGVPIEVRIRAVDRLAKPWKAVQVQLCLEGRNLALAEEL
jgi:hypothetical protein